MDLAISIVVANLWFALIIFFRIGTQHTSVRKILKVAKALGNVLKVLKESGVRRHFRKEFRCSSNDVLIFLIKEVRKIFAWRCHTSNLHVPNFSYSPSAGELLHVAVDLHINAHGLHVSPPTTSSDVASRLEVDAELIRHNVHWQTPFS